MNIFLAITLYDGKIHGRCSESILKNCLFLMKEGHKVTPYYSNNLYIDLSRNMCVKLFLESDCDVLVFIDSDLEFEDDAILKLIKHDRCLVAGAYRYKKDIVEYPITLDFSRNNNCKDEETGLVYTIKAPTGLMKIKRGVFNKMIFYYDMKQDSRGIYSFFDTGLRFGDSNDWYGEDVYFCRRFRESGGDIFVEPRLTITHLGSQEFKGNYHEYLIGRTITDKTDDGINGWMSNNELAILSHLASLSESVVEIGSWKGRSTKCLLEACAGTVYAVDHWNGSSSDASGVIRLPSIYNDFMKNVGHYENLEVLKGYSVDVAANFNGNKADMVFIDAGHLYEECKSDIEAWLPKCNKILCGHDYNFDGVKKAVTEKFSNINVVDSLWWVRL